MSLSDTFTTNQGRQTLRSTETCVGAVRLLKHWLQAIKYRGQCKGQGLREVA
jgi:hypothetical protein